MRILRGMLEPVHGWVRFVWLAWKSFEIEFEYRAA